MADVAHVVVTRFAVRLLKADGCVFRDATADPAWVARRVELFERYAVPSMRAQTFPDWTWLVYVHEGFDPAIAARLEALDARIRVSRDPITPMPPGFTGILATTRLDSDDGYHERAMRVVHEYALRFAAGAARTQLLGLRRGYWMDHDRAEAYAHRGGAFLTLFERTPPYVGVYVKSCDDIMRFHKELTIRDPLWLRVVHGGNVTNRYDPTGKETFRAARLRDRGFPWLEVPDGPDRLPEPEPGPASAGLDDVSLPTVALAMRTTDRRRADTRSRKNYVKGTVGALAAQGVTGLFLQGSRTTDGPWLRDELGALVSSVELLPTEVDRRPNATGVAALEAALARTDADWVLLLEDDLAFCRDFVPSVRRWLAKHARADRNVFRFWGFERPGHNRTHAFEHTLEKLRASQAIALRRADATDFVAWAATHGLTWRRPGKADPTVAFDKFVAAWALGRWPRRPGVSSWPHFVDHVGDQSSIHKIGGLNHAGFAGSRWSYPPPARATGSILVHA